MPGFAIDQTSGVGSPSHNVEFHRSHRWKVTVNFPTGSTTTSEKDMLSTLYANSVDLPELSLDEDRILGGSLEYKIAKRAVWNDVTVKLYDIYGIYQAYKLWQDLIWTPLAGIKPASQYKSTVVLEMLDGKGNSNQKYTLRGAYPKRIAHGTLSYTSSDIKLLTIVFSYDYADIVLSDELPSPLDHRSTQLTRGAASGA